jgi:hypothetical protein
MQVSDPHGSGRSADQSTQLGHLHLDSVLAIGGGGRVLLAADSQSTSKSGYRASLWDP